MPSEAQLFELDQGDALVFEWRRPHRSWNPGDAATEVMWIVTPPSF